MKFEYVIQHNEMLKSFLQRHQYSKKTIRVWDINPREIASK